MPAGGALKLLIVDDHEIVREGLRGAIARDERYDVVADAADAEQALTLARRTLPDVAIVDMHLPAVPGEEVARRLRELLPSIIIVMLSSYLTEEAVRRAAAAGAWAYVTKAAGLPELRATLDRIHAERDGPLDPVNVPQIVRSLEELVAARGDDDAPTPQQARVLELAAEGLTYQQIAERLMISPSTVRFHIQKLKIKLGAGTKTELIVQAVRHGVIAPPQAEA